MEIGSRFGKGQLYGEETKLVSVTNPRLFPTKHLPPQLKLFALDEALGEGGWL
jgi:hypothetical protein